VRIIVNDMNTKLKNLTLISATAVLAASIAVVASAQTKGKVTKKAAPVTYAQVQAIFTKNCIECHSGPKPKAMLTLTDYEGAMRGNDDGSVITPGAPDKSLLFKLINLNGRKQMPPKKNLSKADIAVIEGWIKAGAKSK